MHSWLRYSCPTASVITECGNNGANHVEEAATANTERTNTNARNARTRGNPRIYATTANPNIVAPNAALTDASTAT